MAGDETPATAADGAGAKAKPARRRAVSAKLTPARPARAKRAAEPAAPQPTPEQIAQWKALEPEQRLALREREAVRLFARGLEEHRKDN
ncbi:MAG: hypothetical protein ACE5GT_03725, partial [Rhodospirillales bacterium]